MARNIRFAVLLSSLILVGELVGGLLANSLALLSDAGHVLADVLALSLSWFGIKQAEKPATSGMTYGYHRVGILIAIFNAVAIFVIGGVIVYEAYHRLLRPEAVHGSLMLVVALIGLAANLLVIYKLEKDRHHSLNVRSAFLHAFGDAVASAGVVVGAALIYFTGWLWVDPVLSIVISVLIASSAIRIIKEGIEVVLEATPKGLSLDEMVKAIQGVPGVRNVHDLHVWSITPQLRAMSAHVAVEDMPVAERRGLLGKLNEMLRQRYQITHTTMQLDCSNCKEGFLYCDLESADQGKCEP